jgi:stage V sporulation protein D (sporulation-specific penicillin-binding protein)
VDYSEDGTSRLSMIPGFKAAGLVGASEVSTSAGYVPGRTIASFAGFAPADDPRFVVLVKIDEPRGSPGGDQVAAPVFRAIAQQLLLYFRALPDSQQ